MTRGVGTLLYMAPEQLPDQLVQPEMTRTTKQDARIDIWGLGATLYELITLKPPFEGMTEVEVARKILTEQPTSPSRHQPTIPAELEAVVLKGPSKASGTPLRDGCGFRQGSPAVALGLSDRGGKGELSRTSSHVDQAKPGGGLRRRDDDGLLDRVLPRCGQVIQRNRVQLRSCPRRRRYG